MIISSFVRQPARRRLVILLSPIALLVLGVAVLSTHGTAAPARIGPLVQAAADPISINPGNVPTTAEGFGTHVCDPNQGGGPFPGEDVWVFVLPGMHDSSGDFVSVTAMFAGHPDQTITTATDPNNFSNGGPATSKAWITRRPAGP